MDNIIKAGITKKPAAILNLPVKVLDNNTAKGMRSISLNAFLNNIEEMGWSRWEYAYAMGEGDLKMYVGRGEIASDEHFDERKSQAIKELSGEVNIIFDPVTYSVFTIHDTFLDFLDRWFDTDNYQFIAGSDMLNVGDIVTFFDTRNAKLYTDARVVGHPDEGDHITIKTLKKKERVHVYQVLKDIFKPERG